MAGAVRGATQSHAGGNRPIRTVAPSPVCRLRADHVWLFDEGAIDRFLEEGQREVDLVFSGLQADLPGSFEERFGAQLRGIGERVEVRVGEKHVDAVTLAALEAGAQVISITPHRESLESIFLHAVEEGSR